MRLVDATTMNHPEVPEDSTKRQRGVPWINWLSGGNGESDIDERMYIGAAYDGYGYGCGDSRGNGHAVSTEYHLFGGDHMQLTLLQAWRYL